MKLTPVRLERAARTICYQRGINPDAPHFGGDHGLAPRSMWLVVAEEIEQWLQVGAAIFLEIEDERKPCDAGQGPGADA